MPLPDAVVVARRPSAALNTLPLRASVRCCAREEALMLTPTMRPAGRLTFGLLLLLAALCWMPRAQAQGAAALNSRQTALREALASNAFGQPLVLESMQGDSGLKGDIYAVVGQPFGVVSPGLQGMAQWCDILILHLNVKNCQARGSGANSVLRLAVGRKFDQPLTDAYRVDFSYRVGASQPDYLQVQLNADDGPLGTRDYRIEIEAVPRDAKSSFVHLAYSYGYGLAARLAMQGYLATIGHDKIGFSITGHQANGDPIFITGMRGVVERNTMRYYLAIEAYLGANSLPPAQRAEQRLLDWFTAIERYPRQLHELEREQYLSMKRRELTRQRAMADPAR